jgi:RNA polymerase sigma-70 factor (ECF subfamily)
LALADLSTPYDALNQAQANLVIQRILDTLEPERREVFVLAELEEMTAQQIAEITGLAPASVYSRLRAARTDFEHAASRLRRQEKLGAK